MRRPTSIAFICGSKDDENEDGSPQEFCKKASYRSHVIKLRKSISYQVVRNVHRHTGYVAKSPAVAWVRAPSAPSKMLMALA